MKRGKASLTWRRRGSGCRSPRFSPWLGTQPPLCLAPLHLGRRGWGLGLPWALPCPDPSAPCPRGGTNPAGSDTGTAWCPWRSSGGEERGVLNATRVRKGPEANLLVGAHLVGLGAVGTP